MALGAARAVQFRNTGGQHFGRYQITTGQTVFQGQLLSMQFNTQQHCMPMTATTRMSHLACIGIAMENYATCAATALQTAVYVYNCEARLPATNVSTGHIGGNAYANADASDKVTGLLTRGAPVGKIMELDGTSYAWVWIGHMVPGTLGA